MHMYILVFAIAAIEASGETLDKVAISSDALRDRQQDIETALNGVVELATSVLEDCRSSGADCQGLPHPNIFTINMADYSMVSPCMLIMR